jgi:hypothetical protein
MARFPQDRAPYRRDRRSRLLTSSIEDGNYVYVVDVDWRVWVLPDAPHRHPRVLGNAEPAEYAGDLVVAGGTIRELTNLSGTFQFDDEAGLLEVARIIRSLGLDIMPDAVRLFPSTGARPRILE